MKALMSVVIAIALLVVSAGAAFAHVTIQPTEAPAGAFFRFTVRVPNEREDAATTRVTVRFPDNVIFVSFQPKPGWTRKVTMKKLDEPIEAFGAQIDTVVDTVTWSGGSIAPHEFDEFAFTSRVPEEAGALRFEAVQRYDSGETVRWTGEPDSETPAPIVNVVALGTEEGQGELAVLADLRRDVSALGRAGDQEATDTGTWLGGVSLVVAIAALLLALRRQR